MVRKLIAACLFIAMSASLTYGIELDLDNNGTVDLSRGGTNASNVTGARISLGLGDAATRNVGTAPGTVAAGNDSRIIGAASAISLAEETTARQNADGLLTTAIGALEIGEPTGAFVDGTASLNIADITTKGPWLDIRAKGAIPNDGLDDTATVQLVLNEAATAGKHVKASGGTYKINGELTIPSGLHIVDEGRTTIFDYSGQTTGNFMSAAGTPGAEIPLSVASQRYDTNIDTTTAHGAAVGDFYLVVSQRNALSADAGEWQLGLATGNLTANYFAEVLEVQQVNDTDTFTFAGSLVFPDYLTNNASETPSTSRSCTTTSASKTVTLTSGNTTGLIPGMAITGTNFTGAVKIAVITDSTHFTTSVAATGTGATTLTLTTYPRASATVAKVDFAKNVLIDGITFIAGNGTNKISFQWARDSRVENSTFQMGNKSGSGIEFLNSYRCEGFKNTAIHTPGTATTYNYNTFKIVSSWDSGHRQSKDYNGFQPFDITYGGTGNFYPSMNAYIQECETHNAASNGMTSHAGSYGALITGNQFLNTLNGPVIRSRNTTFNDNIITGRGGATGGYGLGITDGWVVDSEFSNNHISGFDEGILITNSSSQGIGFTLRKTLITGGSVSRCYKGIYSIYDDIQSKTTAFSGLKISNILFSKINDYGIYIDSYLNGPEITDNQFLGPMNTTGTPRAVYFADNVIGATVKHNTYIDLGSNAYAMRFGGITDTTTFPAVDYPNRRFSVAGNAIHGDILGDFESSNSIANAFEFGEIPSKRTWNANVGTSLLHETGNASSMTWSMVTNNGEDAYLAFGDQDAQYRGGLTYDNTTDVMYSRAAGANQTVLSSTYLEPYADDVLDLGRKSKSWADVWAIDSHLGGPVIDVRFYLPAGAVTDASVDYQSGVAAAVAAAYAAGKELYWPDVYLTTASIPNFHSVRHRGPGGVKRDSVTFFVQPADSQTNTLHIATGGNAANDGLGISQSMATFQNAFDATKNYGPVLPGNWVIAGAAGTYTISAGQQTFSTPSVNRVVIRGVAAGHPNVPTTIVDGGGNTAGYLHGIAISGIGVRVEVRDIKFQNFTQASGNTRIGLVGDNEADFYTNNVHSLGCSWTGIYASNTVHARIAGGILDGNSTGAYGAIANDTQATFGYGSVSTATGPIVKNTLSSAVYWSRGSQGHMDYCNVEDNAIGLIVAENSRVDTVGNDFKRNTISIRAITGGMYGEGGAANVYNNGTADANTTNIEHKAYSGDTVELDDQGSGSWQRVAFDRANHALSGVTPTTLSTPYTIAADRLAGTGKALRIVASGAFTQATAGTVVVTNIGGMAVSMTVPAAGTNVAFEIEVTLYEVAGGYRAIGKLTQGLNGTRMATATAGFDKAAAQAISIAATLANAGDSMNLYRVDVYIMG